MKELSKPTTSSFEKVATFENHTKKMEGPVQTQNKRIWIGVKNANGYPGTYNFRVRKLVVASPSPTPDPTPTPNPTQPTPTNPVACNNEVHVVGYGIAPIVGLSIPSLLISFSLLIVVIVQFKKINEISKKITELDRKVQSHDMSAVNAPLFENVQNNSAQEQVIQLPQYPIVYQMPNQMYPQIIQNQANAQPQVVNQQPLSNTQTKQ